MNVGVQTKGLYPEKKAEDAVRCIKEAGFDAIDFNIDAFLINTDVYAGKINDFFSQDIDKILEFFLPLKAALKKYNVVVSQMHAPYPVEIQGKEKQNAYMKEQVIPKCLAVAQYLGIEWVVVHPIKAQMLLGIQKERELNIAYFKSLIPTLKQYQVKVCLENLYEGVGDRIIEGVCANPTDAIYYIDTLNNIADEEVFGLCLDTGHLQLVHRDAYEYIKLLGSRIKLLHLHENDGIGDLHQMPYSFGMDGREDQNWNHVLLGLKEIGFDGTLSFETYPCVNAFPDGLTEQVLKTICQIGLYWKEQLR